MMMFVDPAKVQARIDKLEQLKAELQQALTTREELAEIMPFSTPGFVKEARELIGECDALLTLLKAAL